MSVSASSMRGPYSAGPFIGDESAFAAQQRAHPHSFSDSDHTVNYGPGSGFSAQSGSAPDDSFILDGVHVPIARSYSVSGASASARALYGTIGSGAPGASSRPGTAASALTPSHSHSQHTQSQGQSQGQAQTRSPYEMQQPSSSTGHAQSPMLPPPFPPQTQTQAQAQGPGAASGSAPFSSQSQSSQVQGQGQVPFPSDPSAPTTLHTSFPPSSLSDPSPHSAHPTSSGSYGVSVDGYDGLSGLGSSSGMDAGLDFGMGMDMGLMGWQQQQQQAPAQGHYHAYLANELAHPHPTSQGGHSSDHGHAAAAAQAYFTTTPPDPTPTSTHQSVTSTGGGLTSLPPAEMPLPSTPPYAVGSLGLDHEFVNASAVPEGMFDTVTSTHGHSDEGSSSHHHQSHPPLPAAAPQQPY